MGFQWLEPVPQVTEVGQEVVVRAVDAESSPLVGLPVQVRLPTSAGFGVAQDVGVTDRQGLVRFLPKTPGDHAFLATLPGERRLYVVLQVNLRPTRWLYGVICIPLGLWWLYRNMQQLRSRAAARPV